MAPRLSIIPGDFSDDARADVGHFRVLNHIGRHIDRNGWCRLKQLNIAVGIGLTRETVNRKLKDLVEWGYVEKRAADATGRAIYYRVILDRPGELPQDPAGDDAETGADEPVATGGPVRGGSHVGYNTGAELHPTCDPPLTPGVIAGNHTRCDRIGSQQERPFLNDKKDSPPSPQGAREGERDLQLTIKAATTDCPHVAPALARILDVVPIQHKNPRALIAEVVAGLRSHPEAVLDAAAGELVRTRKKIVSPKCVLDAAAKAFAAAPVVRIQEGDPSYQAWQRWHTLRGAQVLVSMARQHGFAERSVWPPGQAGGTDKPQESAA